ncbi:MAG: polyprenyl synthetase family protein [Rhodocyclales bacterium]|nr:polyprenyl synthetase family protein [Rhodocyclales bacterium]
MTSAEREPFETWCERRRACVEHFLDQILPAAEAEPLRLHEAMRYAVLGGGKRIRPLLVFASGEAFAAPAEALLPVAAAVELIHAYSLVHDDLPAMDDDALRHGRPTVHVAFDEATALLTGDALQTLAFQLLATPLPGLSPDRQLSLVHGLARAAGSRGMAGGQALDLAATGRKISLEALQALHRCKTGALIRYAVLAGAHCGEPKAEERAALERGAEALGLLFQITDDLLDATADSATLGKTAGKDERYAKATYVTLLGLEGAREAARRTLDETLGALEPLGKRAERLRELARFVANRRH